MTTPKSHQETFDFVVRALIKQGRPSVNNDDDGSCMYRGADGCKCAAGHLIPDDKYDPDLEGATCDPFSVRFGPMGRKCERAVKILKDEGYDVFFVRQLQQAHDDCSDAPPAEWLAGFRERARGVAERFGLDASSTAEVVS